VPYPCERNENLTAKEMTLRVDSIEPHIIPLDDGTFLLYDQGGNLILRFDRSFNSRSDLLDRKVFVVEHGELVQYLQEYFRKNGLDSNDQTINDGVYEYIVSLRKAGGK